ncbi:hypothetical protein E2C01_083679 [Portunus trituberculatus]|uniref:Uncharacterized protein n=1 Tax=Portunus trituberculatus TaxID=210409 RepID=A0A5B7J2C5_PORTR|nr:hypothetical protein [Portunus trituberculatus]
MIITSRHTESIVQQIAGYKRCLKTDYNNSYTSRRYRINDKPNTTTTTTTITTIHNFNTPPQSLAHPVSTTTTVTTATTATTTTATATLLIHLQAPLLLQGGIIKNRLSRSLP